ncbi:MAG: peroxiredoxin [Rhodospirillales bacterium]|nr:peroxiredoxin [Alphaproteobacteria bacterium]MBL6947666.1 peroxiredoxin [Rhodospirillales bacterium]
MTISTGDKIPAVDLSILTQDGPGGIATDEIFSGKKVAIFGLPGAFTRTCSARHLPGYVDNADALKAKGIDTIVCIAVNDAFVMGAWGKAQNVGDKVMMVADGSAKFAKATGLDIDMSAKGFGVRCQRFSMVVNDGTVESLHIDEPGTFETTSAEVMLGEL